MDIGLADIQNLSVMTCKNFCQGRCQARLIIARYIYENQFPVFHFLLFLSIQ